MKINYFDCPHMGECEDYIGDIGWIYGCEHPDGDGHCSYHLDNKYDGKEDDCRLLDSEEEEVI